jgi:prevent-host-death family protein
LSDAPIPASAPGPAPGLEGWPRIDAGALEESLPRLVDAAVQGPVVLTRNGADTFVLLPVDAWARLWGRAPRPPMIDAVPRDKA